MSVFRSSLHHHHDDQGDCCVFIGLKLKESGQVSLLFLFSPLSLLVDDTDSIVRKSNYNF